MATLEVNPNDRSCKLDCIKILMIRRAKLIALQTPAIHHEQPCQRAVIGISYPRTSGQ
jgi:hypothetical protein